MVITVKLPGEFKGLNPNDEMMMMVMVTEGEQNVRAKRQGPRDCSGTAAAVQQRRPATRYSSGDTAQQRRQQR
jgi:hypothetical protein